MSHGTQCDSVLIVFHRIPLYLTVFYCIFTCTDCISTFQEVLCVLCVRRWCACYVSGAVLQARLRERSGLSAFILMERIRPEPRRTVMLRNTQPLDTLTISELGIFGSFLRKGSQVGGGWKGSLFCITMQCHVSHVAYA
jgi:Eukaryotic glutathione synthase, ATP binding domain